MDLATPARSTIGPMSLHPINFLFNFESQRLIYRGLIIVTFSILGILIIIIVEYIPTQNSILLIKAPTLDLEPLLATT